LFEVYNLYIANQNNLSEQDIKLKQKINEKYAEFLQKEIKVTGLKSIPAK
jgi:exonuclease III